GRGAPPSRRRVRSALQVENEFRLFWRCFPSRKPHASPKKTAQQLFDALVKGGVDAALLIARAEIYARAVSGTNPQYICQAVTWLRQRRWEEGDEGEQAGAP